MLCVQIYISETVDAYYIWMDRNSGHTVYTHFTLISLIKATTALNVHVSVFTLAPTMYSVLHLSISIIDFIFTLSLICKQDRHFLHSSHPGWFLKVRNKSSDCGQNKQCNKYFIIKWTKFPDKERNIFKTKNEQNQLHTDALFYHYWAARVNVGKCGFSLVVNKITNYILLSKCTIIVHSLYSYYQLAWNTNKIQFSLLMIIIFLWFFMCTLI